MNSKIVGKYLIYFGITSALSGLFLNFILGIMNKTILIITVLCFLLFTCIGLSLRYINEEESRRNKASFIILFIGLFITVLGLVSKYFLQIVGASQEIIIGISVLCLSYGPLFTKNRLHKWLPYASSRNKAILLALTDLFSVLFIFLGVIFSIQHWPGGNPIFYLGVVLLLVSIKFWNSVFKKEIVLRKEAEIKLEKQKNIVEEKNREILDSIEYALRIQTAILPPRKIVKQYLENSFILYKPKDIVAGDFYWMESLNDLVLFAACDCTGHGVPGAMVSVVCHNSLNRAVREFGLTKPAAILDKTAQIVLENFSKSEEEIQDGMDISICALNTKTKSLEWAGANNPLILIYKKELIEIKADKQCIGYNNSVKSFTNHQFNLQADTKIYLFTDGFADQFGGQPERKLTKKRFRELLLSIQHLPIQQQATELDNYLTIFKKEIEQTDDILVIGVNV